MNGRLSNFWLISGTLSIWSVTKTTISSIKNVKSTLIDYIYSFTIGNPYFSFVFLSFQGLNNFLIILSVSVLRVLVTKSKLETNSIYIGHQWQGKVRLFDFCIPHQISGFSCSSLNSYLFVQVIRLCSSIWCCCLLCIEY